MAQFKSIAAVLLLSLWLFASSVHGSGTKVSYCDKKGNYDVKVEGVSISPNPVKSGDPATFSISATTGEAITGGKLIIEVSLFGVRIHTETHELCSKTKCPVAAGEFEVAHGQELPGFTPAARYVIRMRMIDEKNHPLTCIEFPLSIEHGLDVASM